MASTIAAKCPFCGESLTLDTYRMKRVKSIVYCDNDSCAVKPCTEDASPSKVFADVAAWKNGEMEG